jgi:hypothetical protein
MEKRLYTCQFCQKEFEPTRRKVQKFCSHTCRSKNHYHQKNKGKDNKSPNEKLQEAFESDHNKKTAVDELSLPGVGNSFFGSLAVEVVTGVAKNAWKREADYSATKGDINEIKDLLRKRYFPVVNITSDALQRKAYYDMFSGKIVFYNEQLNKFELPMMDL